MVAENVAENIAGNHSNINVVTWNSSICTATITAIVVSEAHELTATPAATVIGRNSATRTIKVGSTGFYYATNGKDAGNGNGYVRQLGYYD